VPPLIRKILASFQRDRELSVFALARKAVSNVRAIALAPVTLGACDHVGARPRTFGIPHVENRGTMSIGDDFAVSCRFGDALLATGEHGALEIGNGVTINYGTAISASSRVRIGDDAMVGPYCVICDTDLPLPLTLPTDAASPIEIGTGAWLAARVIVRPGVHIGAHAVVAAGSVVESDIPAYAIASGAPAKVLHIREHEETHGHAQPAG
jgi:acetyltransferase-like isoleucine patch superfamily enzyme